VTVRVRSGLPSLRKRHFAAELERSLRETCERGEFRVVHYSIQRDHLHLLVESAGKEALGRGMKAVSARIARAVNRVFRRKGPVLAGRYHLRVLRAPREVRNALAYALLNARRHGWKRTGTAPPPRIGEASSGRWFDGWRPGHGAPSREPPPVSRPHTWLLRLGWRRHGLIDPAEIPGVGAR
jgi:REP element-mobilizing transposase RayT